MVYYTELPTIAEGVGVLFDTPEAMKKLIKNMLGQINIEDKYLFISNMSVEQFREYYRAVMKKCEEINEIFIHEDGINVAVVCPKIMFVFHNLESCYLLKSYLEKIEDEEELVNNELIYQSTEHIVMTLDILAPLL